MIRKLLLSASLFAALSPVAASAAWQEASSAHFVVYADDKPEKVRAFTEELEKFDKALRIARRIPEKAVPDAERVRVYMIGDTDAIERLFGKGGSGVAGFYQPRVGGPVAFVPRDAPKSSMTALDAHSILFHEYTHHFMFMAAKSVVFPAWFVEGYAEFNATAQFEKDGGIVFGKAPAYRINTLFNSDLLPASKLVQLDPGKLDGEQRDALYSRGWLLTHMLTFDPSRAGQFDKYIAAINAGQSATDAAKVFGDLKKLDSDMNTYAGRPKIIVGRLPASALTIGPVTLRDLTPGEAAVMPALIQTQRGVDKTTAQDVVKLARKLAAPFPTDAGAQNELAEAEYDAGNYAEADAAVMRALKANVKSVHALLYKGMIRAAQLRKAEDTDPAHWREARYWFARANGLDPDNPLPLMLFYTNFIEEHVAPTANAEDGLLAAYNLAPFAFDLRMMAANIMLNRGDKQGARTALLPVAFSPHRASFAKTALEALTAIDAGDMAKARAALTRGDGGEQDGKGSGKDGD